MWRGPTANWQKPVVFGYVLRPSFNACMLRTYQGLGMATRQKALRIHGTLQQRHSRVVSFAFSYQVRGLGKYNIYIYTLYIYIHMHEYACIYIYI